MAAHVIVFVAHVNYLEAKRSRFFETLPTQLMHVHHNSGGQDTSIYSRTQISYQGP